MESVKIIIFSGTTEGRKLSTLLSNIGVKHIVCVASEYGMDVMDDSIYADIRVGRLDTDEMKKMFLNEGDEKTVIVDATHPYAAIVTDNIKNVANENNLEYIRIIRDRSDMTGLIYSEMEELKSSISDVLKNTEEKVMLTTGSKDLHILCNGLTDEDKSKLYVRVLPSVESINICLANGIEPGHIIAMQGPFSTEMNVALLKQYDIRHLVTKESGVAGGFEEKITAARECDVTCHILSRKDEAGIHVEEAFEVLKSRFEQENKEGKNESSYELCKPSVTLIGRGMGTASTMTREAVEVIEGADAVFGASRLISDISCDKKYEMYRAEEIIPVLQSDKSIIRAVIVFSGDSGFYSGATAMKEKLEGIAEVNIICGISSVSYLSSKLAKTYEDACICSLHGRNSVVNIKNVINNILHNKKTFVLLSGPEDVRTIGYELEKHLEQMEELDTKDIDNNVRIYVGINLSYDNEKIECLTVKEAKNYEGQGIMTGFVENELFLKTPVLNMIRDEKFLREKVPMTKECVRHESIIALNLKKGDVVYDVGGGTGSVAIEIAKQDPTLKVYTIEKKAEAVELIRKNKEQFGTTNVEVIEGEAPEVLEELEPCDAVFVGGSSGKISEILKAIRNKRSGVRVVINAVSIETICEVNNVLNTIDARDIRAVMLSATDIKELGSYHMLQSNNPVLIYSFIMI